MFIFLPHSRLALEIQTTLATVGEFAPIRFHGHRTRRRGSLKYSSTHFLT